MEEEGFTEFANGQRTGEPVSIFGFSCVGDETHYLRRYANQSFEPRDFSDQFVNAVRHKLGGAYPCFILDLFVVFWRNVFIRGTRLAWPSATVTPEKLRAAEEPMVCMQLRCEQTTAAVITWIFGATDVMPLFWDAGFKNLSNPVSDISMETVGGRPDPAQCCGEVHMKHDPVEVQP
ncbi:hypothetical protein M513_03766 [Trichuris suis]|uniref:Uncharacterized protein n=1 Tax=Trichuris suis TaxID=68888 RepID=A0A085MDY0_9BILA|nr:hypothetical protein M513_03766 [Trichuris suis]